MALDARRLRARDLAMSRRAPTRYAVAASALPSTPTATRRVGRTMVGTWILIVGGPRYPNSQTTA